MTCLLASMLAIVRTTYASIAIETSTTVRTPAGPSVCAANSATVPVPLATSSRYIFQEYYEQWRLAAHTAAVESRFGSQSQELFWATLSLNLVIPRSDKIILRQIVIQWPESLTLALITRVIALVQHTHQPYVPCEMRQQDEPSHTY